jgi:hypothetical protein
MQRNFQVTLQVSERNVKNYKEKLSNLNSLSVLHAINAFQVILREFDLLDQEQKSAISGILEKTYAHEDSIRALPEGNRFGIEHLHQSEMLIDAFFSIQKDAQGNLDSTTTQNFERIVSNQRIAFSNFLLKNFTSTRNHSGVSELIAEYLVAVDSQYTNPTLFPEKIYLRDETADRTAAFVLAAFVMADISLLGNS